MPPNRKRTAHAASWSAWQSSSAPGDHVELSGALWQSEEARRELEREFADRVREKGAECSARVICAYKQGAKLV